MKKIIFCIFVFASLVFAQSVVYVKYKSKIPSNEINKTLKLKLGNFSVKKRIANPLKFSSLEERYKLNSSSLERIVRIVLPSDYKDEFIATLKSDSDIEYVQVSGKLHVDKAELKSTPNDSLFTQQWGLNKIDILNAWEVTQGVDSVVVGVIDTGIDFKHTDLSSQIYQNKGEIGIDAQGRDKRFNGIDDDGNGFVDDYMGWNFVNRNSFNGDTSAGDFINWDNCPMDEHKHGTAVAGIIAATTNNVRGISGIAPKVKVLNLRAFDATGDGEEDDVVSAILYAVKMKAKVINMSFGDDKYSLVLQDIINFAYKSGVVLIGSSGNDNTTTPHYPSGFNEVISVGASNSDDQRASSFSNYGSRIDLVAPGQDIVTTSINGKYEKMNGTSFATPHVAGVAALLMSIKNYSPEEVRQILKSTTDDIGTAGWDAETGSGRLNASKALHLTPEGVMRFENIHQDDALVGDSCKVNLSVLLPDFQKCELYYGMGDTPKNWTLISNTITNQFFKKNIATLYPQKMKDTVYTLRLLVYTINGTREERVNFSIQNLPPKIQLAWLAPMLNGANPTIMSSAYTNQNCTMQMFYRILGTTEFNKISMSGSTTNIKNVNQIHYTVVPYNQLSENNTYQIYFEATNKAGITTKLLSKNSSYYVITITSAGSYQNSSIYNEYSFDEIYTKTLPLYSSSSKDIIAYKSKSDYSYVLSWFDGYGYKLKDSLYKFRPVFAADLDNDGKIEVVNVYGQKTEIIKLQGNNSLKYNILYSDTSGTFVPAGFQDFNRDGKMDCIARIASKEFGYFTFGSDLKPVLQQKLSNFSEEKYKGNDFRKPLVKIGDFNQDGKTEVLAVDYDGDIVVWQFSGAQFSEYLTYTTYYPSADDIDVISNSGSKNIVILSHSSSGYDLSPFYYLGKYAIGNKTITEVDSRLIYDKYGDYDLGENISLKCMDVDSDNNEEILLSAADNMYVFNNSDLSIKYYSNIRPLSNIFVDSLYGSKGIYFSETTKNGIKLVGINKASDLKVINATGFSNGLNSVTLKWNCSAPKFYIYKGTNNNSLVLYDSTDKSIYTDKIKGQNGTYIYYSITSSKKIQDIIPVYIHDYASITSVDVLNQNTVILHFSEKINISNFSENQFYIGSIDKITPNSVAVNDEKSYALIFKNLASNCKYLLHINGLNDLYGAPINSDSIIFKTNQDTENSNNFFVSNYKLIDKYTVEVYFNKNLDTAGIHYANNYNFEPINTIENVEIKNNNILRIKTLLRPIAYNGLQTSIKIKNIKSADGEVLADGAGNSILISQTFTDLSNFEFYPNPVKMNKHNFLRFANLPSQAELYLFSIEGRLIRHLEINNKTSYDWDLRDDDNNLVNSGIYFYKALIRDDSRTIKEEKSGKIAIIR